MSYVSYFDLLGTRGFCEDQNKYFEKMQKFHDAVYEESHFIDGTGHVGIFSDCAYAESADLNKMLMFLVEVRDRLLSDGLFFNAVLKKGDLSIELLSEEHNKCAYGISFGDSFIAELYISQTKFKGIGISVDKSLVEEINSKTDFQTSRCIFLNKKEEDGKTIIIPTEYNDIIFEYDGYEKEILHTLDIFLHEFYSSYIKSSRFGMYYISAFSNFLRSYEKSTKWKWDNEKKIFSSQPVPFKVVEKILKSDEVSKLTGIEYLALVMLDIVYNISNEIINEDEKKKYTKKIFGIDCVKNKFLSSLDNIPSSVFTPNTNNRNLFIEYCQDDFSDEFVTKILE